MIDLGEFSDTEKEKFLTFKIMELDYGIRIKFVRDIIGFQEITKVPDMPEYMKGIINLRGEIIPVIDIRQRFGLDIISYHERTCIIVISFQNNIVGLIVDEVNEVLDILKEQIQMAQDNSSEGQRFVWGLGKFDEGVKLLVNLEQLLDKSYH